MSGLCCLKIRLRVNKKVKNNESMELVKRTAPNQWVKFSPCGRWERQKATAPYPCRYALEEVHEY